jgi:hypothetical protein
MPLSSHLSGDGRMAVTMEEETREEKGEED